MSSEELYLQTTLDKLIEELSVHVIAPPCAVEWLFCITVLAISAEDV
jgi:hypothetical protein